MGALGESPACRAMDLGHHSMAGLAGSAISDSGAVGAKGWKPTRPYIVIGLGAMSLPALLAAGLDARVAGISCDGCLVSFIGLDAGRGRACRWACWLRACSTRVTLGSFGVAAPRPLVLASAVEPTGEPATPERIRSAFEFTRQVYRLVGAAERVKLGEPADLGRLLDRA